MATSSKSKFSKIRLRKILILAVYIASSFALVAFSFSHKMEVNDFPTHFDSKWRQKNQQPIKSKLNRHIPNSIMIHHTGSRTSDKPLSVKLHALYEFSTKKKNWGDIPYHFYIDRNGEIALGRPLEYAPDTNTTFNPSGYINIVLEGDFSHISKEKPSQEQLNSMKKVVKLIQIKYGIQKVVTHNEKTETLCPGKIDFGSIM